MTERSNNRSDSENRAYFRSVIRKAGNNDPQAVEELRQTLAVIGQKAPRHALVKICDYIVDEIWRDADREALEGN